MCGSVAVPVAVMVVKAPELGVPSPIGGGVAKLPNAAEPSSRLSLVAAGSSSIAALTVALVTDPASPVAPRFD